MQDEQLAAIRQKIDQIDTELLALIKNRMALSAEVSQTKGPDDAIFRPGREAEMFARLAERKAACHLNLLADYGGLLSLPALACKNQIFQLPAPKAVLQTRLALPQVS